MYFSARRPKIFTTSFGSTSDGGGGRVGEGEEMVAATAAEEDVSSSDVVDDDNTTESSSCRQFDVPWHDGRVVNIGGAKLTACPVRIIQSTGTK